MQKSRHIETAVGGFGLPSVGNWSSNRKGSRVASNHSMIRFTGGQNNFNTKDSYWIAVCCLFEGDTLENE